jgi:TP901-1 family phage major tail protein
MRSLGTRILINSNAIAGLTSIGGLELSADTIDITTLDNEDGYRKFAGGLKDAGEVSIIGYFEPGDEGQGSMKEAFDSGDAISFSIIFPQGASWAFNGIVTGFSTGAELEDEVSFEASIKVSGKPTLGFTASAGLTGLTLTGAGGSLTPTFATGTRLYTFSGVSATSVTITATGAGQTIKLFVDGAYVQELASGAASNAISLSSIGTSKKLTILANETGTAPKIYEIIVVKTS